MSPAQIVEWLLSGGLLVFLGWSSLKWWRGAEQRGRLLVRAWGRARRAERVALEASLDDEQFSPEAIRASVNEMLELAAATWAGPEPRLLRAREDAQRIRAWAHGLSRQLGPGLALAGAARVDILSVVNREQRGEDRVITRVRLRLRRHRSSLGDPGTIRRDERWTLVRHGDGWRLVSITGDPVAGALLSGALIPSPDQDSARLHEASLRELASQDHSDAIRPGELIGADGPPDRRLQELAVLDDRFSTPLLEATIVHIVEAWERASDGSPEPLRRVTTSAAAHQLLSGAARGTRRFIKDPVLKRWSVTSLEAELDPPCVTVAVRIEAAVVVKKGKPLSGSYRSPRLHDFTWTLALEEQQDGRPAWRLLASE